MRGTCKNQACTAHWKDHIDLVFFLSRPLSKTVIRVVLWVCMCVFCYSFFFLIFAPWSCYIFKGYSVNTEQAWQENTVGNTLIDRSQEFEFPWSLTSCVTLSQSLNYPCKMRVMVSNIPFGCCEYQMRLWPRKCFVKWRVLNKHYFLLPVNVQWKMIPCSSLPLDLLVTPLGLLISGSYCKVCLRCGRWENHLIPTYRRNSRKALRHSGTLICSNVFGLQIKWNTHVKKPALDHTCCFSSSHSSQYLKWII